MIHARGALLAVVLVWGSACGPSVQGIKTGHFIPDEKLAAVQICRTTGQELLAQLGEPFSQGRDGEFATIQWSAMIVATDNSQAAMASQNVYAWVDSAGLVAGFVVNPAGLPTKPEPCASEDGEPPPSTAPAEPVLTSL